MKRCCLVIALALATAYASDSWGESKQPPSSTNAPSKQPTQPATPDQRGTDQSPFSVKILPAPDAEKQTEKQERARQEKELLDKKLAFDTQRIADYTWWLASLTGFLFVIAVIQAGFFFWQLRYMRQGMNDATIAANAAALSARATVALELPLIRAEPIGFGTGVVQSERGEKREVFGLQCFEFTNRGRTKAFPIELDWGWIVSDRLPNVPEYRLSKSFELKTTLNDTDGAIALHLREFDMGVSQGDTEKITNRDPASQVRLRLYCRLTYEDFMYERRTIGFCWKYLDLFAGGKFIADATPAYNQRTP